VILEIDDKEKKYKIGTMNRVKSWNAEKPDIIEYTRN
jgi:hypothetical protein